MEKSYEKYMVAGALLSCMFFFVVGYFWGKRSIAKEYNSLLRQYTLDEKIQGALCALARNGYLAKRSSERITEEEYKDDRHEQQAVEVTKTSKPSTMSHQQASQKMVKKITKTSPVLISHKQVKSKRAYAQLAGFGTKTSANKFKDKLLLAGYPVHAVERCIKIHKGKRVCEQKWYQVVTDVMLLEKVQNMVTNIARKNKLTGYKIIKV